jgi:hypothetical protein
MGILSSNMGSWSLSSSSSSSLIIIIIIQFFILTCWLNSYKSQLQSQHKKIIIIIIMIVSYKVKVKVSRYTQWRRLGETRCSSYSYLTSTLDRGEWLASRPGRALPPGKGPPVPRYPGTPVPRYPGTHWIGGWVGPRAGLDAGARRKILCLCRGSNLDLPIVQPVVRHYTAWAPAAHITIITLPKNAFNNFVLCLCNNFLQ